ncbi:DNA primase, partial [bacterium]|nr:DNA primase [bacterium]
TTIDLEPELENRCLILTVNESREQTSAIQQRQREKYTLEGIKHRQQRFKLTMRHQNAQRLIRPLFVVNPFTDTLSFPNHRLHLRRDNEKYLTLINTIALLYQHQREIKIEKVEGKELEYIEVTKEDIEQANRLFPLILERSLEDLPPQTVRLLAQITQLCLDKSKAEEILLNDVRFTRWELRRYSALADTQLKLHLARLVSHEYLLSYREHVNELYQYELLYVSEEEESKTAKNAGITHFNTLFKQVV